MTNLRITHKSKNKERKTFKQMKTQKQNNRLMDVFHAYVRNLSNKYKLPLQEYKWRRKQAQTKKEGNSKYKIKIKSSKI